MAINTLLENLQNTALFDHPVDEFKVLETHASWVLLTGHFAYKIKKPVDFEFLNYSTLDSRKKFCEKELELNKRLASEIYLEVLPITGREDKPEINGQGEVIEYVLKMREFKQEAMFPELLKQGKLTKEHIIETAKILAEFHLSADHNSPADIGTAKQVHEPVTQNFDQIRPLLNNKDDLATIDELEKWADEQHKRWHAVFESRKSDGFIRACHGDVHLGNITTINQKPVIFDCIEFNEEFRWTDVMGDLGFLIMDLHDHEQEAFANILLNKYLEHSGDYAALTILPYYQAYRAMVRAKVSLFELNFANPPEDRKTKLVKQYQRFIDLAKRYAKQTQPFLAITHGLSGSGKSSLSKLIVEQLGVIQVRSDSERKRLAGMSLTASSDSPVNAKLYSSEMTQKTYQRLLELSKVSLQAGYSVIVDAVFLKQAQRECFQNLADELTVPFIIIECQAPHEQLKKWIEKRSQSEHEVSEANHDVLNMQIEAREALSSDEAEYAVVFDMTKSYTAEEVCKQLQSKCRSAACC